MHVWTVADFAAEVINSIRTLADKTQATPQLGKRVHRPDTTVGDVLDNLTETAWLSESISSR